LKVAADANCVESQNLLAYFFKEKGITRKAIKWFERAGEAKDADAAYELCLLLHADDHEKQASVSNLKRSLAWLEMAVRNGSSDARRHYHSLHEQITNRLLAGMSISAPYGSVPAVTGDGCASMSLLARGHAVWLTAYTIRVAMT